jgi:hypothetical protein
MLFTNIVMINKILLSFFVHNLERPLQDTRIINGINIKINIGEIGKVKSMIEVEKHSCYNLTKKLNSFLKLMEESYVAMKILDLVLALMLWRLATIATKQQAQQLVELEADTTDRHKIVNTYGRLKKLPKLLVELQMETPLKLLNTKFIVCPGGVRRTRDNSIKCFNHQDKILRKCFSIEDSRNS